MQFDNLIIAKAAFAEIAKKFPNLSMVENPEDPVDLSMTLPVQQGLKYKLWLSLQNKDELHFGVGDHFHIEYFSCAKPENVELFVRAVTGFVAGELRVLAHYRGHRCVKSELQKRTHNSWHTVGTCMGLYWPIPWQKTYKVLRNN